MFVKKIMSTLLLTMVLMASFGMTIGNYVMPESVYAASNISSFSWAYTGSGVDGRTNGIFHNLGKGTAQLKVAGCSGYTGNKKATVVLRKSKSSYPFYENCGTVKFYQKGIYNFGSVRKGSYWLHVSGGKTSGITKSATGKVQNK